MPSSFLPTPPNARQDAVATHRRYLATALLLAAGSQLVACGGPDAEVVLGSPTPAPEVLSLTIELNGPAQSLERHDFELLVATEGGIKQLNDSALIDLDILSIDGSASTTGAIRAATTLSDGSVFYVAENGLFYGEGERILPSPLNASITASDVHAAYALSLIHI